MMPGTLDSRRGCRRLERECVRGVLKGNRLVKVTRSIDAETTEATYSYDGLHRRTQKVVG